MAFDDAVTALEIEFQRLLARGGEATARGELEPAREALEEALAIRSRDPQVLGLLGQVFYRLTRYEDAAVAWQRLVDDNPVEPGARVNLGLAWLKARQYDEAVKQLRIALDLNPEHRKAAGYLGLAWLELGQPHRAREWFVKAGSEQMVARCDDLLAAPAEVAALEPTPEQPEEEAEARAWTPPTWGTPAEVAPAPTGAPSEAPEVGPSAAPQVAPEPRLDLGLGLGLGLELETGPGPAAATAPAVEDLSAPAPEPDVGADVESAAREPAAGEPIVPLEAPAEPSFDAVAGAMPTLSGFAAARQVQGPAGQVFVAEGATLTVNVHGELLCRLAGLAAWRGELAFAGEVKRFRGLATDKPFGEPPEQMHRVVGEGLVVLRAAGRRFTVLELGGETGYFREAVVFGFQEQVAFENGRLPSASGGLDLVHLRGRGRLVLVTRGEPVAVAVTPASPVHVPLASLVGWTGALTPRIEPLFAGGADEAVEISGEGRVLVDPGPTDRRGDRA